MNSGPLLSVRELRTHIRSPRGVVRAVDGVSFDVGAGESFGVVGESGSGKSVMARTVMGLSTRQTGVSGEIVFKGRDLLALPKSESRNVWGKEIAMVFQDPGRALNPVVRVERQLTEGMRKHLGKSRSEARGRALELLKEVGISDPERRLHNYPHEMSGGMRQRLMIAIALACEPDLLIADEPTTALDVTIQRQILDLLRRVQRTHGMSMILISHDLAVVAGQTDRVGVMYAGRIAEVGATREVFQAPRHRYTEALLSTTPTLDHQRHARFPLIDGALPDPTQPPPGCRFESRCHAASSACSSDGHLDVVAVGEGHLVWCMNPVQHTNAVPAGGESVVR
ncbi:peptide/nickel transport system ATP-binding protein [Actinocorallia herbida]|uniref:Peptide/nickel transport system ATP-binding protein n=1 Tax=Actinocorallia herbida TaxID=58109 RepID=A0A3N1D293_9ACTN|nr:ABC transporter ATP-binding protein [Actinocorallia herbida]ROO87606.1 peptide/nickel transport system ATP-binding protein [Actinocorallia herbida]